MAYFQLVVLTLQSHFSIGNCRFSVGFAVEAGTHRKNKYYLIGFFNSYPAAESAYASALSLSTENSRKENTVTASASACEKEHILGTWAVVVVVVLSAVEVC